MQKLSLKILVVDPNELMPEFYRRQLRGFTREGATLEFVDRPARALAKLDAGEVPDVIITHGGLYCQIGIRFAQDLVARGFAGGIVMVSAGVGVTNVKVPDGLFDAVLPKPFNDPSDLTQAIRAAIKAPSAA